MTPQGSFMVAAPIRAGQADALRALLATMNAAPGHADPANSLVPFGRFETLHVARFAVLEDRTAGDLAAYGAPLDDVPLYLMFIGDCDGPGEAMLDALAHEAEPGLRRIFAHCEGFGTQTDLRAWMGGRSVPSATTYVNWIGRTVRQGREEAALHQALIARAGAAGLPADPEARRLALRAAVAAEGPALTPLGATPFSYRIANALDLVGGIVFLLVLAPFLLLYAPVFLLILRAREASDPVIPDPPDLAKMAAIGAADDHDVTNAFTAIGEVKPGLFRLTTVMFALWLLNFANRHLYARGRLARVGTIHFARWVLLDGRRRMMFASNYDGALDSYMDDFINKAGFGLNLVFGNGVGYPKTRFLILEGASDEQKFKAFLRRRQIPTDVWYKALTGLTTFDLDRNAQIRAGLEAAAMTTEEARRWLALI